MTHRHSPELIPLRMDHTYLRGAPGSAYWQVAPHLIQQVTDSSCSLATAVMLLNTVRGCEGHLRSAGPVSEGSLLDSKFHSNLIAGLDKTKWSELSVKPVDSGDVSDHPYPMQFQAFFDALGRGEEMRLTSLSTA